MPQYAEGFVLAPTMKPMGEGKTVAAPRAAEAPKAPEKIDFSRVEIEPLFKDFVDFDTFSKSDFRAVKVLACEAVPKSRKLLKFTLNDGTGENRTILRAGSLPAPVRRPQANFLPPPAHRLCSEYGRAPSRWQQCRCGSRPPGKDQ